MLFMSFGVTSCSLTRSIVRFALGDKCSSWDISRVLKLKADLGPTTPVDHLKCALNVLRHTQPDVEKAKLASKICMLLADQSDDESAQNKLAAEGYRWAKKALELGGQKDGEIHYYLSVNLGIAVQHSMFLAAKKISEIIKHLKIAKKLSPDVDMGGPQRVLGVIYMMAPEWPKGPGDIDRAEELLSDVAKKYPDHPLNHFYYAQVLYQAEGGSRLDEIKRQLKIAKALTEKGNWGYLKKRWLKMIMDFQKKLDE